MGSSAQGGNGPWRSQIQLLPLPTSAINPNPDPKPPSQLLLSFCLTAEQKPKYTAVGSLNSQVQITWKDTPPDSQGENVILTSQQAKESSCFRPQSSNQILSGGAQSLQQCLNSLPAAQGSSCWPQTTAEICNESIFCSL